MRSSRALTLLSSWGIAVGFSIAAILAQNHQKGGDRMPIADPFFQKIGWQLIHPPDRSRTALERASAGLDAPKDIPGAGAAIDVAKAWIRNILNREHQPPPDAVFVAIPNEAGVFDAVRVAYFAGGLQLEVGQTFSMFNVAVRGTPEKMDAAAAERLGKLLLNTGAIAFDQSGEENGFAYGKQRVPCKPFECDWTELLRWWSTASASGFITVKTTKAPSRAVVGPDEDLNRIWFDIYKPR